jgi:hypothetical protein
MPTYEASTDTAASAEDAWAAWTDVASWSSHDHVESASIDGEFRVGAKITTKARGFPSSTLTVTRADEPRAWVDESRSPVMRMSFEHVVDAGQSKTLLTERVRIAGPLGYVVGPLLRRRFEALFAASVAAVARQAEGTGAQPPPSVPPPSG